MAFSIWRAVRAVATKLLMSATCLTHVALWAIVAVPATAQLPSHQRPKFEVASVKPVLDDPGLWGRRRPSHIPGALEGSRSHLVMHGRSLAELIAAAYTVRLDQVSGPAWITERRYDIDAKMPAEAPYSQAHEMLQGLLEERFKLTFHRETRIERGYELKVGPGGPRLQATAVGDGAVSDSSLIDRTKALLPSWTGREGTVPKRLLKASLPKLAESLSDLVHRPVVDVTGIVGEYDVVMEISIIDLPGMAIMAGEEGGEPGPSVFEAVERLGLVLKSAKVPVERLVVDNAERLPVPN